MHVHLILFCAALIASSVVHAQRVNKCTGADGKVVYQERPCTADKTQQETQIFIQGTRPANKIWSFSRQTDKMTGAETCFAASPIGYLQWGPTSVSRASIFLQVAVGVNGPVTVSLRGFDSQPTFHYNLNNTGIKIDDQEFQPFTISYGDHGIGFSEQTGQRLLDLLKNGREFNVRVRFWPYQQPRDTITGISLTGYGDAVKKALSCAIK